MNGKSKVWAVALLGSVLLLGGAVGATAARLLMEPPTCPASADGRDRHKKGGDGYLDRLSAELELSPSQREQVEEIAERHRERMSTLWRQVRPRFEEMKAGLRGEIRGVLTEEQLARYEELVARRAERRRDRDGR